MIFVGVCLLVAGCLVVLDVKVFQGCWLGVRDVNVVCRVSSAAGFSCRV